VTSLISGNDRDFIWKGLGGVQGRPEGSADPDFDHLHLDDPPPVAGSVLRVQALVLLDAPALRNGAPGSDSEGGVPADGSGPGVGYLSGGSQDREHPRRDDCENDDLECRPRWSAQSDQKAAQEIAFALAPHQAPHGKAEGTVI